VVSVIDSERNHFWDEELHIVELYFLGLDVYLLLEHLEHRRLTLQLLDLVRNQRIGDIGDERGVFVGVAYSAKCRRIGEKTLVVCFLELLKVVEGMELSLLLDERLDKDFFLDLG